MRASKEMVFAGMGLELVGLILGAVWLGQILDEKFSTGGVMVLVFLVGSLVGWIVQIVFLLKQLDKNENSGDEA